VNDWIGERPAHARWLAFHFYYHGQQDFLLEHLLRPLVASLLRQREIDSFFFVRSLLGGPHIRLRLRLRGTEETIADAVESAAERFFQASPSLEPMPEEEIQRINRAILKRDPAETDDSIYPDNSVWSAPFHPEVERYGGPELLAESLAFFAVSSCQTLQFHHQQHHHHQEGDPAARLLPFALYLLSCQALGFVGTTDDFLALVAYPVRSWETTPPSLVERGDQVFASQKATLLETLRRTVEELTAGRLPRWETEAARRLGWAVQHATARRGILGNQLHMTANRLGLRNAEEVYVARLLWRTATELAGSEPLLWNRLGRHLRARAAPPPDDRSIEGLLPAILEQLWL